MDALITGTIVISETDRCVWLLRESEGGWYRLALLFPAGSRLERTGDQFVIVLPNGQTLRNGDFVGIGGGGYDAGDLAGTDFGGHLDPSATCWEPDAPARPIWEVNPYGDVDIIRPSTEGESS